jgi:hypothetical protein
MCSTPCPARCSLPAGFRAPFTYGPSIERARAAAEEAGVSDRTRFAVEKAKDFPGSDYDLVAVFDSHA